MTETKKLNLKEFYINNKLIINCIMLAILYIFQCFFYATAFVIYPILLILVLSDKLENAPIYLIFNLPFCLLGQMIGIVLYCCCFLSFLLKAYIVIFVKDKIKIDYILITLIAIFVLYSLSHFNKINVATFVNISTFTLLFLLLNLYIRKREILNINLIIKTLSIALICAFIFGFLKPISPYLTTLIPTFYLNDNLIRYSALFTHPNSLAITCEICLGLLAYQLFEKKNVFSIVSFILISIFGFTTFSKTFLIIFLVIMLALFIKFLTINYKITLIVFGILVLLGIIFFLIFPNVFTTIINRFIGSINECKNFTDFMNMITTYRYDLWALYIKEIFASPLNFFFGHGVGADKIDLLGAHNTIISIFYQFGIVGFAIILTILVYLLRKIAKINKFNKNVWITLVVIFLLFMVEDLIIYH